MKTTFKTKAKNNLLLSIGMLLSFSSAAADWDGLAIPANAGEGKSWQLQTSYSDDFNYTGKPSTFTAKWKDSYFKGWSGPGLTEWNSNKSWVADGNLIIEAGRKPGTDKVHAGVITSKTKVKYPIYLEARIKVSNLELSSNFWLLSENDQREIDVLEVYGGAKDGWFSKNMSTNFHVFVRDEADNSIKNDFNDQTHHHLENGGHWRDSFHRFGVYWKSPTEVTFYIDGKQTADGSWAQAAMKDKDYTGAFMNKNQYKMDQEAFIIIDTEDHEWRSRAGNIATDAELADNSKNKMYVDWIRVYKPVANGASNRVTPPTATTTLKVKHSGKCVDVAYGALINGSQYHQWGCNTNNLNQQFKFTHLGNDNYALAANVSNLCMEVESGNSTNGAKVQQWVCNHANTKQQWQLWDKGNNWFEIRNKESGKCLSLSAASPNNGAKFQLWNCYGGNNQQYKFLS